MSVMTIPARPAAASTVSCPCCGQPVTTLDLDMLIDVYRVPPGEAIVLSALWRGKGHPISAYRLFDAMFADDPDGGPGQSNCYKILKVRVSKLRKRLKGSAVSIEAERGRGYRLVIGEK